MEKYLSLAYLNLPTMKEPEIKTYHSWEVLNHETVIKNCDKSFFKYKGSGIPFEVLDYFNAKNFLAGQKREIILKFNKHSYNAYIINNRSFRVQIRWFSNLGKIFSDLYTDTQHRPYPKLKFTKIQDNIFNLSFIPSESEIIQTESIDTDFNSETNEKEQQRYIKKLRKSRKTKEQLLNLLSKRQNQQDRTETYKGIRNKRDNESIAIIKYLRKFKCQLCGKSILKRDGTYYVEAAHIDPKCDKGRETLENILLLCPNHHKEFDLGKREIIYRDNHSLILKINGETFKISLIV